MIWVDNFLLIFCTLLLGSKRLDYQQIGWGINAFGNLSWTVVSVQRHLFDYSLLPFVLGILAIYNFIKVHKRRKVAKQYVGDIAREVINSSRSA